jgi:hypothetical protein
MLSGKLAALNSGARRTTCGLYEVIRRVEEISGTGVDAPLVSGVARAVSVTY